MHDKTHGAHHAHAEHVTQHGGVHVHEVKGRHHHHGTHHQATQHHAHHAGDSHSEDPRGRFKRGGKANGGGRAGEDCDKKCTKDTVGLKCKYWISPDKYCTCAYSMGEASCPKE